VGGITKREFARRIGVDPKHVGAACAAGCPERYDGRLDYAEAIAWIITNSREGSRLHDAALSSIATSRVPGLRLADPFKKSF
jgi:hypothetical protein